MKTCIPAMALAAIIATPAHADGFPSARIELDGGWDHVSGKLTYTDSAAPQNNFSDDRSTDGFVYGATVGYDVPVGGGIYLGAEAGFDFANNQRCEAVLGNDAACFDVKRNYALGGRVGARLAPTSLFYVGAAYVNGRAKVSYTDNADPTNNFAYSDSQNGYRISVGAEQRLAGRFFAKVEYRYSNYSNYTYASGTQELKLGFIRHQVVAGLGVRF